MRVLINALQAGNLSGTGRYTEELVRLLIGDRKGVEVHAAWPESVPRGFAPPEFLHRVPVHGVAGRLRFDQWGIQRLAQRLGVELIHYPANIGALRARGRTVLTVHDLSFYQNPAWFRWNRALYYRSAVRRSVAWAAHIITDSEASACDLGRYLGFPRERISVIPLGVDAAFTDRAVPADEILRQRLQLPNPFLLFVGTLEPRKNIVRLVQAFDRVAPGMPHDLVLVGRRGWKNGALDAALTSAAHRNRIHLPGFVADGDLPGLLRLADGFVYPSLCEGFGLPPLEAMACGTPVLTSAASSLPEVTGGAALLVAPECIEAIAEGLLQLIEDTALRENLRAAGLARAAEFTWSRTAEATRAAYAALEG